jgi:hypothetical protein
VLGNEYYDDTLEPLLRENGEVTAVAREWASGAATDEERIERIGHAIAERIRYVSIPLAGRGWEPQPPLDTVRNGYGDCKDMSVLAVALLRSLGIEAHPVVLRTRDDGLMDVGSVATFQLNHMIVHAKAGNTDYWFDPTAGAFRLGELPWADRGVKGLLISDESSAVVALPDALPQENMITTSATLEIDEAGVLTGSIEREFTGEFAHLLRNYRLRAAEEELARTFEVQVRDIAPGADLLEWDMVCDAGSSCTVTTTFRSDAGVESTGDLLICDGSLFCPSFPEDTEIAPPRTHDIVFGRPCVLRQTTELAVPDGWSVRAAPDYASTENAHGSVTCAITVEESGAVHAVSEVTVRSARVPAVEASAVVEVMDAAATARREVVVLERAAD